MNSGILCERPFALNLAEWMDVGEKAGATEQAWNGVEIVSMG